MSSALNAEDPAGLFCDLGLTVRKTSGNVSLRCPLPEHDDSKPSFSLKAENGQFFCHGCGQAGGPEMLARLVLEDDYEACKVLIGRGYVVSQELADIVGGAALREMRSASSTPVAKPVTRYEYADADGQVVFRVVRHEPGRDGGTKSFHQEHFDGPSQTWQKGRGGIDPIPFRLPALIRAVESGQSVYIAEGEKDVIALENAGVVATTNPGGAKSWSNGWGAKYFSGADEVTVIADRDDAGRGWAQSVVDDLAGHALSVKVVEAAAGKDAADHLSAGLGIDDFRPADLESASQPTQAWPPLIPLDEPPFAPLPLEGLPSALRDHVEAVAESLQVSTDMPLILDLATVATASQGQARVLVAPDWSEELSLFAVVVAESGERKSGVAREASLPIREFEAELADQFRTELHVERARHDAAKKRLEHLKGQAAKASTDEQRYEAQVALEEHVRVVAEMRSEAEPRLLVDDITPQALATQLEAHHSLGVLSAEGGLFETFAGRFENQVPNIDLLLKAYSGEPARIDRVGRQPEHLERPLVTLGLAVQPDVLEKAASNPAFVGRGLTARFLLVTPESRLGYRALDVAPIPASVKDRWRAGIKRLAREPFDAALKSGSLHDLHASLRSNSNLSLSSDAQSALRAFQEKIEAGLRPDLGRYRSVQAAASKTPGLAVRIAANLHLLEWGPDGLRRPIDATLVQSACKIAERSLEEHRRHFARTGDAEVLRHAKSVLRWASDQENMVIAQSSITGPVRQRKDGPQHVKELEAALARLERHGLARRVEQHADHADRGSRLKPMWEFRAEKGAS